MERSHIIAAAAGAMIPGVIIAMRFLCEKTDMDRSHFVAAAAGAMTVGVTIAICVLRERRMTHRVQENRGTQLNSSEYSNDTVRKVELLRMMEGQSCMQKFPRQLKVVIVKVQAGSHLEGVCLGDLKADGVSGKHFTVVMIDRSKQVSELPTKWRVIWTQDVQGSLQELTPTRWHVIDSGTGTTVRGTPIDSDHAEEMDMPMGAIVDASDLREARRGTVLTFVLNRCDLFPQASTHLQTDELICYGCPSSCHLELGPLTDAGAKWLQKHTDSKDILTHRKRFRSFEPETETDTDHDFVKELPDERFDPEVELLAGFQRVYCMAAQPQWEGEMPQRPPPAEGGKCVTFKFQPRKLIDHIMQAKFGVPPNAMRTGYFDLDYFELNGEILWEVRAAERVSDTQPMTIGLLNFRKRSGITVVGIASLRAEQQNYDTMYDTVWFPGPKEPVKEGDLFIILRAPSSELYGPSERIVREEDVRRFATEGIRRPRDVCAACLEAPPNIQIMPCGHKALCVDCCNLMQRPGQCPVCRRDIAQFIFVGKDA